MCREVHTLSAAVTRSDVVQLPSCPIAPSTRFKCFPSSHLLTLFAAHINNIVAQRPPQITSGAEFGRSALAAFEQAPQVSALCRQPPASSSPGIPAHGRASHPKSSHRSGLERVPGQHSLIILVVRATVTPAMLVLFVAQEPESSRINPKTNTRMTTTASKMHDILR